MSRKSRQKKKKKQKLQKRIEHVAPIAAVQAVDGDVVVEKPAVIEEKTSTPAESESIIDEPTKKLIRKDVQMIMFTLLGLALVLVAVRILGVKTPQIDTFGNWLYKITNIQTM